MNSPNHSVLFGEDGQLRTLPDVMRKVYELPKYAAVTVSTEDLAEMHELFTKLQRWAEVGQLPATSALLVRLKAAVEAATVLENTP